MLLSLAVCSAQAVDLSLAGVFGGKAVLVIDGGAPRTLAPGARSPEGVKLLSVEGDRAWVDIDGRRVLPSDAPISPSHAEAGQPRPDPRHSLDQRTAGFG